MAEVLSTVIGLIRFCIGETDTTLSLFCITYWFFTKGFALFCIKGLLVVAFLANLISGVVLCLGPKYRVLIDVYSSEFGSKFGLEVVYLASNFLRFPWPVSTLLLTFW